VSNFLSGIKTGFLFPSLTVDFCHQLILLLGACSGKGLGICYSHYFKITEKLKENSNLFSVKDILISFVLFLIKRVFLKRCPKSSV